MEVNPGHVLGYYAYFFDEYAPGEIETLSEVCRSASLFVDVGAHSGMVSLAVAQACPHVRVLSFEPDCEVFAVLKRNCRRNPFLAERIEARRTAVAARDGRMPFVPSHYPLNPEIGHLAGAGEVGAYTVEAVRLDSVLSTARDGIVVKIDVEGAELDVLHGMERLFRNGSVRAVLVETHAFRRPVDSTRFNDRVVGELHRWGFSTLRLEGRRWRNLEDPSDLGSRGHVLAMAGSPTATWSSVGLRTAPVTDPDSDAGKPRAD